MPPVSGPPTTCSCQPVTGGVNGAARPVPELQQAAVDDAGLGEGDVVVQADAVQVQGGGAAAGGPRQRAGQQRRRSRRRRRRRARRAAARRGVSRARRRSGTASGRLSAQRTLFWVMSNGALLASSSPSRTSTVQSRRAVLA